MSRIIINDEIDLSIKDTEKLTYDSLYKKDNAHLLSLDSANKEYTPKGGVYAILSVADKLINNRKYSYDSLKLNVLNEDWTKPFNKPFLKNHDIYTDSLGRIKQAWFIDHENLEVSAPNGQDSIPEDVINFFKDKKCFNEGTGSTLVELTVNADTYERIQNGFDQTVSQSSYSEKNICSICHQPYFGGNCSHFAGEEYKVGEDEHMELCYVSCSNFEPVELSIVNNPANKSSILYISNNSNKKNTSDDKEDEKNKVNDSKIDKTLSIDKIKDNENNIKNEHNDLEQTDKKMEDSMFKDLLKKSISKLLADKLTADGIVAFEKLFDSLETEEQISSLQTLLDNISEKVDSTEVQEAPEEKTEDKDNEKPEEKEPEDTKGAEETKDNKNSEEKEGDKKAEDLEDVFQKEEKPVMKDSILNKKAMALINNL